MFELFRVFTIYLLIKLERERDSVNRPLVLAMVGILYEYKILKRWGLKYPTFSLLSFHFSRIIESRMSIWDMQKLDSTRRRKRAALGAANFLLKIASIYANDQKKSLSVDQPRFYVNSHLPNSNWCVNNFYSVISWSTFQLILF